jgi:hypothetical protein
MRNKILILKRACITLPIGGPLLKEYLGVTEDKREVIKPWNFTAFYGIFNALRNPAKPGPRAKCNIFSSELNQKMSGGQECLIFEEVQSSLSAETDHPIGVTENVRTWLAGILSVAQLFKGQD